MQGNNFFGKIRNIIIYKFYFEDIILLVKSIFNPFTEFLKILKNSKKQFIIVLYLIEKLKISRNSKISLSHYSIQKFFHFEYIK